MEPTDFGAEGANWIRHELELEVVSGTQSPKSLASRLRHLALDGSFAFYPSFDGPANFDSWIDEKGEWDGKISECQAAALAHWLSQGDDLTRVLVLEDSVASWSDAWVQRELERRQDLRYLGEALYVVCEGKTSAEKIDKAFSLTSEYPGVGVLARLGDSLRGGRELTEGDLDSFAEGAVAVLACAFDAEGYLFAPVMGRLSPDELPCSEPDG
jgi:hypothetical protein